MLVNAKGEVHAYQFYPAVMFSQARFTYTEVAAILANTQSGPEAAQPQGAGAAPAGSARRVPVPCSRSSRYRAERWTFETTETQIVCDDSRTH